MTLRKRWTPEDEALCLDLWREGKTQREIADVMDRGLSAVKLRTKGVARKRGYLADKRRPWTDQDDALVDQMRGGGKKFVEIAQQLGRPAGSISARLHQRRKLEAKDNLPEPEAKPEAKPAVAWVQPKPRPAPAFTADQDARLRSYMADGIGLGGAASLLRIHRDRVAERWAQISTQEAAV